jgi:hypothetical protein
LVDRFIDHAEVVVMAEPKTKPTEVDARSFLNRVEDARQRADAFRLLDLMREVTGQEPRMWGPTIVGFGEYHYVYDSGHEGDTCLTGFSPRKGALALYFTSGLQERFAEQLRKLGKAKAAKGCLYVKKLADVDLDVLREMIRANVDYLNENARSPSKLPGTKKRSRSH